MLGARKLNPVPMAERNSAVRPIALFQLRMRQRGVDHTTYTASWQLSAWMPARESQPMIEYLPFWQLTIYGTIHDT